jgi:hypothetical protein
MVRMNTAAVIALGRWFAFGCRTNRQSDVQKHPLGETKMIVRKTTQTLKAMAKPRRVMAPPVNLTRGSLTKRLGSIASAACLATLAATAAAPAQQQKAPVTALVVMTHNGPATCDTWIRWRLPAAHPVDKAAVEYWAEGYLSGLAAGSHHDVIGQFRREELVAWLDHYCIANPQTPLPAAINALGRQMLAHPGGPL